MRKTVKNDKVIKAITIGLATMLATTTMPLSVYAEDGVSEESSSESGDSHEEGGSENDSESGEEEGNGEDGETPTIETGQDSEQKEGDNTITEETAPITPAELLNECAEVTQNIETTTQSIGDAQQAVESIVQPFNTADTTAIQESLASGMEYLGDAKEDVDTASGLITEAMVSEVKYEKQEEKAEESEQALENSVQAVTQSEQTVTSKTTEAKTNANIAETSGSKEEAYKAKETAENNVKEAEDELTASVKVYETASQAAEKAQSDYDLAKQEYDDAVSNLKKAKESLGSAKTNATAANEQLKAAQQRVNELSAKVQHYAETKEELEGIQHQYYAMLVQYYREILGRDGTMYNDDGTLDIAGNAKKVTQTQIDNRAAAKNKEKVMMLGRNLLEKLVTYKVMNDSNVDWTTAEFTFGTQEEGLTYQDAYEGKIFESDDSVKDKNGKKTNVGQQQVVVDTARSSRGRNDKNIKPNQNEGYYWALPDGNGGRTHRVHVQYKDKDGNLHDEYYNYIFKSSKYGDVTDLEKGMVYLALIKQNETSGEWETDRVYDENNFDDYTKVVDILHAVEDIEKYNAAVKAVEEAADQVNSIQEKIDKMQNAGIDKKKLGDLKAKLDLALEDLTIALNNKLTLEDKLEEAKDIVSRIDLSRFDEVNTSPSEENREKSIDDTRDTSETDTVITSDTSTDSDTDDDDIEEAAPASETTVTVSIPGLDIEPITLPAYTPRMPEISGLVPQDEGADTGVAGVRASKPIINANNIKPVTDNIVKTQIPQNLVGNTKNNKPASSPSQKGVRLGNNQVPLAQTPYEETVTANWWKYILAALGAIGTILYADYKRRKAKNR